jgi:hypothetical protein
MIIYTKPSYLYSGMFGQKEVRTYRCMELIGYAILLHCIDLTPASGLNTTNQTA